MRLSSATIVLTQPIRRVLWTGLVDVPETAAEAATGLSRRLRQLDAHEGMLFGIPAGGGITMAQTRIPLDIIWLDAARTVVAVESARPNEAALYKAPPQASMAMELRAGTAARRGIVAGAMVTFRRQ